MGMVPRTRYLFVGGLRTTLVGVVGVALSVAGCDTGSPPIEIENHCAVAMQVSYSTILPERRYDQGGLELVAIEIPPGDASEMKPDLNGGGFVVVRNGEGDWRALAPLDGDGSPPDRVYRIDGADCE